LFLLSRSNMRTLVVLTLALCCSGQIAVPYIAAPYPWAIKYQGVDGFGQTTYGHQALDQTRHETRLADGRVIGQYSFIDPNGEPAVTYFEAGPNGYRVLGSNVLPEGPSADYVPEYSEDVARAREEFLAIFEEARKGNIISPAVPAPAEVAAAPAPTLAAEKPADEEAAAPAAPEVVAAEGEKAAEEYTAAAEGEAAAVAEEAVETARRRRDVARVPLPYLHAVPTETKTTIETKQFEPVDAATPADTKKIALTTKEHTFTVPGFKYVQPTVEVKPVQYSLLAPQVAAAPYAHGFYPGFGYPLLPVAAPAAAAPAEE